MKAGELKILLLLASVQFLAFLDFEFLMPLGTYIGPDLGISVSRLGELVSAYTFAGMLGALLYSRFADRWEKRAALCWLMSGLALGTLCCAFAKSYGTLLAARILAGFMAGPSGATVLAIVSEVIPEERRGQGMGIVFGGFTVASVIGVPLSIFLANLYGWRRPFTGLALLAVAVIVYARLKLPKMPKRAHSNDSTGLLALYRQPVVWLAWASMAALVMADFAFVPYVPNYLTANLGLDKSLLAYVYAVSGLTTLITFQASGRLTDRFGTFPVYWVSSFMVLGVMHFVFFGMSSPIGLADAIAALAGLYFTNAPRALSAMTLFTKAPPESQQGEFMSLQNVVQQGFVGLGTLFWRPI